MEKITSFLHFVNKHEMYVMIDGLLIGCVAFYGFVTWQKDEISTSKQVSYILVALIVLECLLLILTSHSSRLDRILVPCIPIFTATIFMFLLIFSRKESLQNSKEIDTSNFLDIDFLIESNFKEETTPFWKMNRIFSFTCFTLSIFLFLFIILTSPPEEVILFSVFFLVGSIILWFFPKVGSWIFSILSILVGLSLLGCFCYFVLFELLTKNSDNNLKDIFIDISLSVIVFSLTFMCINLAMLLLSNEAQQEWKENKSSQNQ
jgi:hypothetical protein